ncbi:MAG: hypothetical protein H6723_02370 [Sandaracinus sp.]|nr:hypothetical protein [Sandaracinus sp.]
MIRALRLASLLCVLAALAPGSHAQAPVPEAASPTFGATRRPAVRVGLHVAGEPSSAVRELRSVLENDLAWVPALDVGRPGRGREARVYVRPQGPGFAVSLEVDGNDQTTPVFVSHRGQELRALGHAAASDLVLSLTGERPSFEGRLAFARREPGRRKQIWVAEWDGFAPRRVSSERHTALLPGFVGPVLWWSVLEPHRSFLTHEHAAGGVVMESGGTDMGIAGCGDGLVLSSSRSGDSEVWWARSDGSALRRLTEHAGIDVSPSCAAGRMAFVSDRDGTPRVFLSRLRAEGGLDAVTPATAPGETQTPTLCASARGTLLAYTRLGGAMRVELLDVDRGHRRVVSPPGWAAKDPSFSPDCRLLAYVARGRGVVVASVDDPTRHRVVVPGAAETVRWGPPPAAVPVTAERADALAAPR